MQSVLIQNNCHAENNYNNKTNEQNKNRLIQVIYRQFAESTRFITDFMILVNVFCFLIRYQYLTCLRVLSECIILIESAMFDETFNLVCTVVLT